MNRSSKGNLVVGLALAVVMVATLGLSIVWLPSSPNKGQPAEREPGGPRKEKFGYKPSQLAPLDPAKIVRHPKLPLLLVKDQVLATLRKGVTEQAFRKVLAGLGVPVRIVGRIPSFNMLQLEVPADQLHAVRQRLANHPSVAAAGLNFLYSPSRTFNDPALSDDDQSWGIRKIRAPEAWDVTTGTATIAIIDSGSKVDHEELAGKIVSPWSAVTGSAQMQEQEYVTKQGNRDFAMKHGTHVAITAAGTGDNGRGTAGIAPTSPVMPVQVLRYYPDSNDVRTVDTALVLDGFARAIASGAQVINYSVGPSYGKQFSDEYQNASPERKQQMEQQAQASVNDQLQSWLSLLDQLQASRVILVTAAGNDGLPALFDPLSVSRRVISVAATDKNDQRASFSNYGDYTTVSAPGVGI
jgi:hypothetical protein